MTTDSTETVVATETTSNHIKRVRSSFTMSPATFEAFKAKAHEQKLSVSALLEKAVETFLGQ